MTTDFLGTQIPISRLDEIKQFNLTAIGATVNALDFDALTVGIDEYVYETVNVAETDRIAEELRAWARGFFFEQKDGFEEAINEFDGDFNVEAAVEEALQPLLRHARSSELVMYQYDSLDDMYGDLSVDEGDVEVVEDNLPAVAEDIPAEDRLSPGPQASVPVLDMYQYDDFRDMYGEVLLSPTDLSVNAEFGSGSPDFSDPPSTTTAPTTASIDDYGALDMYGEDVGPVDMYGIPIAETRTRRAPQRVQVEFVNSAHAPVAPKLRIPKKHIVPPPHILKPGGAYPFTW
jgi:hypothetical protein